MTSFLSKEPEERGSLVSSGAAGRGSSASPPQQRRSPAAVIAPVQRGTVYQNTSNGLVHSNSDSTQQQYQQQQPQPQQQPKYLILDQRDLQPVPQQCNTNQYPDTNHHDGGGDTMGVSSPSAQRSNSEVPILKKEYGPFHFTVELDEKEDTNKTPSWLMNRKNKLYTNINKAVPFHVKCRSWPRYEHEYQVRVTAVFSSHQYARAHVKRCPIHATPQHQTNIDFPFPEHVVRLDHPAAVYEKSGTGRLSVVVPLEQPQAGPLGDTMPLLLRFMCLCSCSGGINRRPLAIIFTLEKLDANSRSNELFGRQTVDVRVCACPMRDYRNEEGNIPRQDRRCGRKRGGRVSNNSLLHHHNSTTPNNIINTAAGGVVPLSNRQEIIQQQDDLAADDVYTIHIRGQRLYEFLLEMKAAYLKTHPEYNDKFPDILELDEVFRMDNNMEDDRLDEDTMAIQESPPPHDSYNNSSSAAPPPLQISYTNTRLLNGRNNPQQNTNIVINNGPSNHIDNTSNNLVVTYGNNDVEMMDQDYVESNNSQNSVGSNQSMSRNSSFSTSVLNNSQNITQSVGPFQQQQQQNQPHQIQYLQQREPIVATSSSSSSQGVGGNLHVSHTNLSNVASIVAHHQIIGSMKNSQQQQQQPRTLSGNLIPNGSNQPVLLIYNAQGMDDQLVQTLNARKIILPKPGGGLEGQLQLANVKTNSSGGGGNGATVMNLNTQIGGSNSSSQGVEMMEENFNGVIRNADVKPLQDSSGNLSLAVLRRDPQQQHQQQQHSDTEDVGSNSSPKQHQQQQFRHIPISSVAQIPSREQRRNMCVAKKMPRLKPIPGKMIPQTTNSSGGGGGGPQQQQQQQQQMLIPSQANGQLVITRNSPGSHQILVPLSQTLEQHREVVSSVYPNMSVVKREPTDYDDSDHHEEQMHVNNIRAVNSGSATRVTHVNVSSVASVDRQYSGNAATFRNTNKYSNSNSDNTSSGGRFSNSADNRFNNSDTSRFSNNNNSSSNRVEETASSPARESSNSEGGMNGQPDSAEMLAAHVLASSLGLRTITAVSSSTSS